MATFKSRVDGKEHQIRIDDIEMLDNEIRIYWTSPTLGWGEYKIWRNHAGKFTIDSEYMDRAKDKNFSFLEALFRTFIENCEVHDY